MNTIAWAKEFIGAGGTRDQWLAVYDAATKQLRSGNQRQNVHENQPALVSSSHSNRGGRDLIADVPTNPGCSVPPAATEKGHRSAAGAVAHMVAKTVLDKIKTHDGRVWGDIGAHELDGMHRDGVMAQAIKNKIGVLTNSHRFKTVRELLKPHEFEAIVAAVKGQSNAA